MENPCKTCIVGVNCTQVCKAKKNLQTLLDNALSNFRTVRFTPPIKKQYNFYDRLRRETVRDMQEIRQRAHDLKGPDT